MKIFLGVPRLATGDGPGRAVAALHAIMGSIAACKRMLWYRSERIFPRTCAVSHPLAIWKARKTGKVICWLPRFVLSTVLYQYYLLKSMQKNEKNKIRTVEALIQASKQPRPP